MPGVLSQLKDLTGEPIAMPTPTQVDKKKDPKDHSRRGTVVAWPEDGALPGSYWTVGQLSVLWLKEILGWLEPASLNAFALRALVPQGKREVPKEDLLRLLEFSTGLGADTGLQGDMRNISSLRASVKELYATLGRRLRDCRLPVDWATGGLFVLSKEGGRWLVSGMSEQRSVWLDSIFPDDAHLNDSPLVLEGSWSAVKARVCMEGSLWAHDCASLLAAADLPPAQTQAKRRPPPARPLVDEAARPAALLDGRELAGVAEPTPEPVSTPNPKRARSGALSSPALSRASASPVALSPPGSAAAAAKTPSVVVAEGSPPALSPEILAALRAQLAPGGLGSDAGVLHALFGGGGAGVSTASSSETALAAPETATDDADAGPADDAELDEGDEGEAEGEEEGAAEEDGAEGEAAESPARRLSSLASQG